MNIVICGANSDISQAFTREILGREPVQRLVLTTSDPTSCERLIQHFRARYQVEVECVYIDVRDEATFQNLPAMDVDLFFSATGYLGLDSKSGLFDDANTRQIVSINYAGLIMLIQQVAERMMKRNSGHIMVLSSVAGERGRQSNFIYGSAKAALTAYLSGLRNFLFPHRVHVTTVIPGFMKTKMTSHLTLNPSLTAAPEEVGRALYIAFKKKKNVVYVKWMWRYIMMIVRNIPESIFKKMKM